MSPEERQLLSGLFDRIKSAGAQPRDQEAESFIGDAVKQQPYAPYLLSQTVIVQEQALRAANTRIQELEAKVNAAQPGQGQQGGSEGFLGGLGRSFFGAGSSQQQNTAPAPQGYPPQGQGQYGQGQPQYGQPQGGPWGQAGQAAPGPGGGFLKGALGMAAGVAGGALLGNAISGLFHGSNNPFGIASGMGGFGGGYPGGGGGETIVNNYYENDAPSDTGYDGGDQGGFDDAADFGSDDSGGSDDGSYDV